VSATRVVDPRARLAWRGALLATVLNFAGSPMELLVARDTLVLPPAPSLLAAGTGVVLFVMLLLRGKHTTRAEAATVFLINTASIAIMLWLDNEHWVTIGPRWAPFQANKLGAITVGLLTPEISVGVISIAAYAGAAVVQWLTWDPAQRAVLARGEPMPTLIFAAFGVVLLVFSTRRYAVERHLVEQAEASAAMETLARTLLAVRDFANTPLQTIESAASLVRMRHPEATVELQRIERALDRMRELNGLLSQHESHLRWTKEDESFDAVERLRREGEPV